MLINPAFGCQSPIIIVCLFSDTEVRFSCFLQIRKMSLMFQFQCRFFKIYVLVQLDQFKIFITPPDIILS